MTQIRGRNVGFGYHLLKPIAFGAKCVYKAKNLFPFLGSVGNRHGFVTLYIIIYLFLVGGVEQSGAEKENFSVVWRYFFITV